MFQPQRVAIVHEWFTAMRGGEKCVEALCEVFPHATVFVLVHVRGSVSPVIERMPIRTSFVQYLPFAQRHYRYYLPLFPAAVRGFRLDEFDCVISSNHCVAKGVRTPSHALHICYCHTPMRYIWDRYKDYFGSGRSGLLTRVAMRAAVGPLRRWDVRTAGDPHYFVANSENVRQRVRALYGRDAYVIYPPVDTARFAISSRDDGYFLIVGALVPYKRIDLAIEACNRTRDRLVVVGDGNDAARLHALAGPTVRFVGWCSDEALREYYAGCRAVLFPGVEDFGIVPLEAMATGKPVVAFAQGGALETVLEEGEVRSGILFREQTVDALLEAIRKLERTRFDSDVLRRFALRFDREVYKERMYQYVLDRWKEFRALQPEAHT